jgi:hypothetical protein
MVQLGLLVEASERYVEVTRLEAASGDRELQEEARRVAAEEREALLPRIPQLKLVVEGVSPDQVQIQLDGKDVPPSLLGMQRPVNPGTRQVVGRLGEQVVTEQVALAEGEAKELTLRFAPPASAPAPPPAAAPGPGASSPPPGAQSRALGEPDAGPESGDLQRTLGWVSIGVGGAGVVVGAITGAILLSQKSKLDDGDCLDGRCGPDEQDRVESYNSLRPVSTTGFVVGGVGLAAGLTLLLTAPPAAEQAEAHVAPWVGIGSAGIAGRF